MSTQNDTNYDILRKNDMNSDNFIRPTCPLALKKISNTLVYMAIGTLGVDHQRRASDQNQRPSEKHKRAFLAKAIMRAFRNPPVFSGGEK